MNNKGFTLVELVVAMLVSSIVIISIVAYTLVGVDSFQKTRSETYTKMESQLINQGIITKFKSAYNYRVLQNDSRKVIDLVCGDVTESEEYTYANYLYVLENNKLYLVNLNSNSKEFKLSESEALNYNVTKQNIYSEYISNISITPEAFMKDKQITIGVESLLSGSVDKVKTIIKSRNN